MAPIPVHFLAGSPIGEEWFERARCLGMWKSVDFFGPDARPAKSFCAACPVAEQCLDWAIDHAEAGVWGGATERERQRLRRQRQHPEYQPPPCECGCTITIRIGEFKNKARCLRCEKVWPLVVGLAAAQ